MYYNKLEPALLHYKFLITQQSSLVGSMVNDIYLVGTTDDSRVTPHLECWEFLLILENVESQVFKKDEFKELFFKYADIYVEGKVGQLMSLSRFCKLCLMKSFLSVNAQKVFFKKHRIKTDFDFDSFSSRFHSEYMVAVCLCRPRLRIYSTSLSPLR